MGHSLFIFRPSYFGLFRFPSQHVAREDEEEEEATLTCSSFAFKLIRYFQTCSFSLDASAFDQTGEDEEGEERDRLVAAIGAIRTPAWLGSSASPASPALRAAPPRRHACHA